MLLYTVKRSPPQNMASPTAYATDLRPLRIRVALLPALPCRLHATAAARSSAYKEEEGEGSPPWCPRPACEEEEGEGAPPWRPCPAYEEEEGDRRAPHLGVRAWPVRRKKGRVPHLGIRAPPARRKKGRAPHLDVRVPPTRRKGRVPHLGVRAWPARRKKGRVPHLGVCAQPARRKKGRAPLGTQRHHLLCPRHGRVATTSAMPSSFVDAPSHPRPCHRAAPPRRPRPWPPMSSSSA